MALSVSACGSVEAEPAPGILEVGHQATLDGVRYELEAQFQVTGTRTLSLDLGNTNSALAQELAPGAYSIAIQPGFHVFKDVAIAELPVTAELSSDVTQAFQIVAAAKTLVSYRFAVEGGSLSFDND